MATEWKSSLEVLLEVAAEHITQAQLALKVERELRVELQEQLLDLQGQLEQAHARIDQLEADATLNKRFVAEHLFCKECDRPTLEWDGQEYCCWC